MHSGSLCKARGRRQEAGGTAWAAAGAHWMVLRGVATTCGGCVLLRWALAESTGGSVRCGGSGCLAAPVCTSGSCATIGRGDDEGNIGLTAMSTGSLSSGCCAVLCCAVRCGAVLLASRAVGVWRRGVEGWVLRESRGGLPTPRRWRSGRAAASTRQRQPEPSFSRQGKVGERRCGAVLCCAVPCRAVSCVDGRARLAGCRGRLSACRGCQPGRPRVPNGGRARARGHAHSTAMRADGSSVRRRLVRRCKGNCLHRTHNHTTSITHEKRGRGRSIHPSLHPSLAGATQGTATHGSAPPSIVLASSIASMCSLAWQQQQHMDGPGGTYPGHHRSSLSSASTHPRLCHGRCTVPRLPRPSPSSPSVSPSNTTLPTPTTHGTPTPTPAHQRTLGPPPFPSPYVRPLLPAAHLTGPRLCPCHLPIATQPQETNRHVLFGSKAQLSGSAMYHERTVHRGKRGHFADPLCNSNMHPSAEHAVPEPSPLPSHLSLCNHNGPSS